MNWRPRKDTYGATPAHDTFRYRYICTYGWYRVGGVSKPYSPQRFAFSRGTSSLRFVSVGLQSWHLSVRHEGV